LITIGIPFDVLTVLASALARAIDVRLEALTVLLEAVAFLALAAFIVDPPSHACIVPRGIFDLGAERNGISLKSCFSCPPPNVFIFEIIQTRNTLASSFTVNGCTIALTIELQTITSLAIALPLF
jgi:hypothetical protein